MQTEKPWLPLSLSAASLPNSAPKLLAIVAELAVTRSPRYAPGGGKTWCNIFFTDVCDAWGTAPTHWMHSSPGTPAGVGRGREMSANSLGGWLKKWGPQYGWLPASQTEAKAAAAAGHLVGIVWVNPRAAASGHVAIMLPNGHIVQAGKRNFENEPVTAGFGLLEPTYYIHTPVPPPPAEEEIPMAPPTWLPEEVAPTPEAAAPEGSSNES